MLKINLLRLTNRSVYAGAEVNIGNVNNILADYEKAELHWKNASGINQSIGNLEQEGFLLQNIGGYYYSRKKYDSAMESYQKALNIFLSIGNDLNRGRILWNIGEVYITICEYQNALNSLNEAQRLFNVIKNYGELLDVLFMQAKLYYKIGDLRKLERKSMNLALTYSEL